VNAGSAHTNEFRVLALDGGGIKGVFVAALLAGFEESLGQPLVNYFDLIAGTSTGGIIAVGLGLGLSAQDIVGFYEDKGPAIFAGHRAGRLRQFFAAKYSREPMTIALEEVFGERLLGESRTRLVIPSLNLETGQVHVFKTAHHERFVTDYKQRAVDVCLSTAAAPTYFPTHRLASGTPLIDGGMWANNPMGAAAVEALGVLEQRPGAVMLLGIGCTESPLDTYDRRRRGLGINYWARRLVDTIMAGQSSSSIGTAQLLLGHANVHRISPIVSGGRYKLDSVGGIGSLKGLGAAEARREFPKVRDMFLTTPRSAFTPLYGESS
jgi:patatin-like phospholipase/acyl hydrolase